MHPSPSLVDALARLAHDQDQDAWAVVLDVAGPDCWRCCRAVMDDFSETEDAFHEALMHVRDKAGQFQPRTAQPEEDARRWVFRVATTTALMMRRARMRAIARDQEAGKMQETRFTPDPAADLANQEEVHAFRDALCALKEPRRTVIAMHHLQGLTVPDIASELGRPQGTIKTWINRGLVELKARMATQGHVMSVAALVALGSQLHAASAGSALPAAALHQAAALLTNGSQPTVHALALTSSGAMTMKIKIAGIVLLAGVTLGAMTGVLGQDVPLPKEVTELPQVMPEGTEQEIDAVVEKAIAAGLPDAKGGKLFRGKIVVTEQTSPAGAAPGNAGENPHVHAFDGVHLRLADGTWVIHLAHAVPSSPGWSVDATALSELPVDKLVATAQQVVATAQQVADDEWKRMRQVNADAAVGKFEPDHQDMVRSLYHDFNPVQCLVEGTLNDPVAWFQPLADDDLAVQTAFLVRLGLPHAEQMAVLCAGHVQCEDERVSSIRDGAEAPLTLFLLERGLPMYEVSFSGLAEQSAALPHPSGRLSDPATSFRRLLAVHFYDELIGNCSWDGHPELEPAQAARAVLALADEAALPNLRYDLPGLVARRQLTGQAHAGADLATRIALADSGDGHPYNGGSASPDPDDLLDHYLTYHATQDVVALSAPERALLPASFRDSVQHARDVTAADLGGLIALVGDGRPSRWLDHGRFRTVGDHALRMIAYVLAIDPRHLIGRDASAPWSVAERAATAAALTRWWQDNQGKSLEQLATPGVDKASMTELACLLQRPVADAQERARQLDLIAAAWLRTPPRLDAGHLETSDLAYVLAAGIGNASFSKVVDAWPLTGPCPALLATWQIAHADSEVSIALLMKAAGLTEQPLGQSLNGNLATLIGVAYLRPNQHLVDQVVDLFNGPLENPLLPVVWGSAQWQGRGGTDRTSPEYTLMRCDDVPLRVKVADGSAKAFAALPLVLDGCLFKDQRLAPDWMRKCQSDNFGASFLADDVRVCDLAALNLAGIYPASELFLPEMARELGQIGRVDLADNLQKRNETILKLRVLVAKYLPAALKEAKLKATIPGVTVLGLPGSDL